MLLAVLGAVIVRQLTGRGAPAWVVFLIGGGATVATGVLPLAGAEFALAEQLPVFLFLFSLFLFAAALERSGALDHVARWVLGRAKRTYDVPFVLFLGFGILSAFLVNDALVLLGVPLLFALARRIGSEPRPLFLTLAYAVTVGSALTPLGNPQNLLVSLSSGIGSPIAVFLRYLLLPTSVNLVLGGLYLRWRYGPLLASRAGGDAAPPVAFFPAAGWRTRLGQYPALWIFPATIVILLTTDITADLTGGPSVPLYAVTFGGALLLLAASRARAALLKEVDWSILLLFAGLFVVVAGSEAGGVLAGLSSILPIPAPGHPAASIGALIVTSLGGAQLVSNVPWVAFQIPLLKSLGYSAATPVAWVALAAGSTLAGNLTLLGAASNLIIVERAEKLGVSVRLREFVRDGIPLTAITVSVLYVSLLLGL